MLSKRKLTTRFIFTHENNKARNAKGAKYRRHKESEKRRKIRIVEWDKTKMIYLRIHNS